MILIFGDWKHVLSLLLPIILLIQYLLRIKNIWEDQMVMDLNNVIMLLEKFDPLQNQKRR